MAFSRTGRTGGVTSGPDEGEVLQAVTASATFAKSPALRKLLGYLWDHRDETANEFAIAVDVFSKPPSFDPKSDATVRVQMSRLRQKLKEYFDSEGAQQPVRLALPPGSYRLEIQAVERPAPAANPLWPRTRKMLLPSAAIALAAIATGLAVENRRLRVEGERVQRTAELPEIWRAMLRPGRLTRVVYPIPVFYSWDKLRVRDVTNNEPDGWKYSSHLKPLIDRLGEPTLSESYSVASDTSAAIQLTRFLSRFGVPLEVTPTASLSFEQYGSDNLVFLGIPPTNQALEKYTTRTNFYLFPGQSSVGNRKPLPGEPAVFREATATGPGRPTRYGLIAVLAGRSTAASVVLFMGLQTASLATFLTSPVTLDDFEKRWREAGRPAQFEIVVQTDQEAQQTRKASTIAFRTIP